MKTFIRPVARLCAGVLLFGVVSGCSSVGTMVVVKPPANPQKLGRVEGHARGALFLAFIPIRENTRTERAYRAALEQAPGAKALMDVTIHENWYWYYLGTIRCVTITGEAVK
jgi:hypothetical protein